MNDVIRFMCSSCGTTMKVPSKASGKKTKCPKCKSPTKVPISQLPTVIEKPLLPVKSKPAPIVEVYDDDCFAVDMLKEIVPEQTITIRETQIVSRGTTQPAPLNPPLPDIRAAALTQPNVPL